MADLNLMPHFARAAVLTAAFSAFGGAAPPAHVLSPEAIRTVHEKGFPEMKGLLRLEHAVYGWRSVGNTALTFITVGLEPGQPRRSVDEQAREFAYFAGTADDIDIQYPMRVDPYHPRFLHLPEDKRAMTVTARFVPRRQKEAYFVQVGEAHGIGATRNPMYPTSGPPILSSPGATVVGPSSSVSYSKLGIPAAARLGIPTVETCQAAVGVESIEQVADYSLATQDSLYVGAQEAFCNSMGIAYHNAHQNTPYAEYQTRVRHSYPIQIGGYLVRATPVDPTLYNAMSKDQPLSPAGHLLQS